MAFSQQTLVWVLASLLVAGCAQSPSKQATRPDLWIITLPQQDVTSNHTPPDESSFAPSTLYSLLVAEFAGHHGLIEVTLHHYLQESIKTEDPDIIRRTVEIAEFEKDHATLLEATLLWAKVEPEDPAPFSIASEELIRQGRFEEAKPLFKRSLELDGRDGLDLIDTLISHANRMKPQQRQVYLALFDELLQTSPDNTYYLFARASLLAQERHYEAALEAGQKALQSDSRFVRAIILVGDLQDRLGNLDAALDHLSSHLSEIDRRRYRNNKEFRLLYARLLMKKHQYSAAEVQADIIALKNRHDENILYYLGALMLHYERLDSSERYFNLLPDLTGYTGELRYYLGRLALLHGDQQKALEYFTSVDDPRYLTSSYNEIGNILNQAEDQPQFSRIFAELRSKNPYHANLLYGIESQWLIDQDLNNIALPLLNEALVHYPEDVRLLYSRAMLWQQQGRSQEMEMDLRTLLQVEPSYMAVLSSLGYSLSGPEQSPKQAVKIKTDDPAMLDKMGWALHDLGDLKGALSYLEKAYNLLPDPEIAAHLGAVYWKLGQPHLALEIWDDSFEKDPYKGLLNKSHIITGDNF